jgi:hypothetical protein
MRYSVPMAVGAVLMQLVVNIWPFVALLVTSGPTWWINAAIAAMLMLMYVAMALGSGGRTWLAVGYPMAAAIFVFILVDSTWRTVRRGGIEWRGTFYPLAALKANDV